MTEDTSPENLRKNLFPNIEIDWESPLLKGAAYDRPHSKEDYIFGFADKITDKSCRAAEALGEIGNKNAVKSLIRLLNGDITDHIYGIVSEIDDEFMDFDDYMVEKSIMSAANALGKIGDEQAIEPLINALEKALESDGDFEDDPTSCGAVVSTIADVLTDTYSIDLAKVPWTTNLAKEFALGDDYTCRDAVELLIKALGNEDEQVRYGAAESLGKSGDNAIEPLIKALEEDEEEYVRYGAANALGNIGDKRAVEPLIKALEDKHWWTRKNAAEALGKIGDKRAVEPLLSFWIKILEDGIGKIGRNNEFARESAVRALIKIGDGAVEPLIKALGDKEEDVRRYTARVLGNIGGKRAVEPLIKALEDKDSEVRQRAATSLGWIGDKRAVEPLIKALEDKDSEVRRFTAIALGRIGDKRAVEPLIKSLDKDVYVRNDAARALANIGDKRAVEPLIKALGDENEYVRRNATIALKKLGHEVKTEYTYPEF
jgi:HEAT repeat protein